MGLQIDRTHVSYRDADPLVQRQRKAETRQELVQNFGHLPPNAGNYRRWHVLLDITKHVGLRATNSNREVKLMRVPWSWPVGMGKHADRD